MMQRLGIQKLFQKLKKFKKLQEFEQLQTSIGKSKKLKLDEFLSKKYFPSAETLHTVDLPNI